MPFRYEQFHPALTDTIAARIANQGAIEAQRAQSTGNAYAGMVQNIGQSVAAIPGQIQQQKDQALRQQLGQQQLQSGAITLAEQKKKLEDDETMARIYQGAYGMAPSQQPGFQGPTQPGMPPAGSAPSPDGLPPGMTRNPDGVVTIKPDYLTNAMAQAGMGDKIPGVLANLTAYQEKAASLQKLKGEIAVQNRDALGSLGATVEQFGNTPQAFHTATLLAIHNGQLTTDQVKPYLDQVDANPQAVAAITKALQAGSKAQSELNSGAITAAARKQQADTGAKRLDLETPKITAETQHAMQVVEGTVPMTPAQKSEQAIQLQNLGVRQAQFAETKRHNTVTEGQTDPNAPVSDTAKGIAEYRIPPPSTRSMASGQGKALMDQVLRANPDYDASQFPTRNAMRKAFTSGSQSQQLTALNTAIEHLGKFSEVADALGNGSFKPGNDLYNWMRTQFGDSAVTNFSFARDIMSGELASAMKKSGATDTEIEKVSKALSSSASPKQLQDAIKSIAIPMIGGKASTLDQQWKQVMGQNDPFSVYTPGAKAVLEKMNGGGDAGRREVPGHPGVFAVLKNGKWIVE